MTFRPPLAALVAAAALLAPAAASAAPPTATPVQTVDVGSATLGYRDLNPSAKGRPLVVISGYGFTMTEWDPVFVERIARGRRTILFDNRGIGTSTGSVKGLTIARMARDAAGLVKALDLGRVDVLGLSMGGYIAEELALRFPRVVGRLILASADPGSPHALQASDRVVAVLTNPDTTPEGLLPILFPADRQAAGKAWLRRVSGQPNLTAADFATPPATMAAQERANAQRWYGRGDGAYARLPQLRAETLVAFGRDDVIVPPGNARLIARRVPNATLRGFPDAGHLFVFQRPAAKARLFARFLDRR